MDRDHITIDQKAGTVTVHMPVKAVLGNLFFPLLAILSMYIGLWSQEQDESIEGMAPRELLAFLWSEPGPLLLICIGLSVLVPVLIYLWSLWSPFAACFDLDRREVRTMMRKPIPFERIRGLTYVPPYMGNLPMVSLVLHDADPRVLFVSFRRKTAKSVAVQLGDVTGFEVDDGGFRGLSRTDANWPMRIILPLVLLACVLGAVLLTYDRLQRGDWREGISIGLSVFVLTVLVARVSWVQWQPAERRPEAIFPPWVYYVCALFAVLGAGAMIWADYQAFERLDDTGWWAFILSQIGEPKILMILAAAYMFWLAGRKAGKRFGEIQ